MTNLDWLKRVIHKDFEECGKSGYIYNKQDTILALSSCLEDRIIDIYNYSCKQINDKTWVVHYVTIEKDVKYFITSIWVMNNNLQLIFHQATGLIKEIDLIKF